MRRLRVGLIGLGEVAQLMHLPVLHRLHNLYEVAAIHDLSATVMAAVGSRWGILRRHGSAAALVCDDAVDVVFVLSPDQHHHEHAQAALRAGKHVFVEKPLCLTRADVERLIAENEGKDRVIMVGYMRRFAPAFQEAKRILSEFDQVSYVRAQDFFCEGPWFFQQTSDVAASREDIPTNIVAASRSQRLAMMRSVCGEFASDALIRAYDYLTGVSSHSISAMRDLLGGSPRRVVGAQMSPTGDQLTVMFDYGDYGVVYEYLIDELARFEAGFEIYSRRKRLRLRYDTPYVRNLPMVVELQESTETSNAWTLHGPFYKDPFEAELEAFYASVANGAPNLTSPADSLADFRIFEEIVACLASSAAGNTSRAKIETSTFR